ncbi:hypothetical protein T08_2090, partial [Trichinella sp. T8]
LWWHGPKWLAHPHNAWPVGQPIAEDTSPVRDERRSEQRVTVGVTAHVECNSIGPERYGCVERLFRITAYCQRFVRNCRLPAEARQSGALTVAELRKAEGTWVRMAQSEAFSSELQALSRKGRVVATSRLSRLALSWTKKDSCGDPAWRPRPDDGSDYTLPRTATARWDHAYASNFKTVTLGVERAYPSEEMLCLLVYVHGIPGSALELVPQMTTTRVMQALRRFIARRGRPEIIQSDNFRSFKAAASKLRQLWRHVDVDRVQRELVGHRIHWKFITERAPWMGGYWERLVRSIKESLRKILRKALLDEEELRTTLCEVEASLNARPLTFVGDEHHERHPLSPFQLLTGRAYVDFPAVEAYEPEWQRGGRGSP